MRDLLPPSVLDEIAAQYRQAVARAERAAVDRRRPEERLTGGLELSLEDVTGEREVDGVTYTWRTQSWSVRGQGGRAGEAPECRYGADSFFELELFDEDGTLVRSKLLPVQAKKEWTHRDGDLVDQVIAMQQACGVSLALDYRDDGYRAALGADVLAAEGRPADLREGQLLPLGEVLAQRFLTCEVGAVGYRYDDQSEELRGPDGQRIPGRAPGGAKTTIKRVSAQRSAVNTYRRPLGRPRPRKRTGGADAGNRYGQRVLLPIPSAIGDPERRTQERVLRLFVDSLGYRYLGNLSHEDNRNVIEPELVAFLSNDPLCNQPVHGATRMRQAIDEFRKAADSAAMSPYDRNREVYRLLRYGASAKAETDATKRSVALIDWQRPERNRFAIAEEVSVAPASPGARPKRPDLVLYVNGIALGLLELKRATVSVHEGIRQNLSSQDAGFIPHFFSTMQLVMAGNDSEGLRYGTIETKEKYYLTWKEPPPAGYEAANQLDQVLLHLCSKVRLLELVHDFVVFDAGTKKLCRHNQYFGVKAAQEFVRRREGGIIWHTQGSGKSLTMVWLARWILEQLASARVLIITDRTELDDQIEQVFTGVGESIVRTRSGRDLVDKLGTSSPRLVCSLIHKFGSKDDDEGAHLAPFIREALAQVPSGWKARGDFFVFVDECHRSQSGDLHAAMKQLLPDAVLIGFTGTPLLKADKKRTIEVFGRYIHTYKYDEAVEDGVVLDLRYEARDIEQGITSPDKIDQWFDAKTRGLTPLAKAQLKARWGTMQKVLSSLSRLTKIVADILLDMETRERLANGRGNALLVAGSIYEACKFYELFERTPLVGKVAIVTSYAPRVADIKGELTGDGETENLQKFETYQRMLMAWFHESDRDKALARVDEFEQQVKSKFVKEPGQMRLLIVVDKLLTGFDAPSATYLYIDKRMADHGLFQAICRVNRLDGDDKVYGYIVDYKDLFKSLERAVDDYTSGAFDGYDKQDVAGLLENRVNEAAQDLEDALDAVRALCEPVEPPRDDQAFYRYFSSKDPGDAAQLAASEPQRLALYMLVSRLVRAFANVAGDLEAAGYSQAQAEEVRLEVDRYRNLKEQVKIHSGDKLDFKQFEPAMRHLIDTYIRAEDSEPVSALDDLTLIDLIVERGARAIDALPTGLRKNPKAAAEAIENNVRRLIIDERGINPKYYDRMSLLLDALIAERRQGALGYQAYLERVAELTRQAKAGPAAGGYPKTIDTAGRRALYDNLGRDERLAVTVDQAVRDAVQDDWRLHPVKLKRVRHAISSALGDGDARLDAILDLVKRQNEY